MHTPISIKEKPMQETPTSTYQEFDLKSKIVLDNLSSSIQEQFKIYPQEVAEFKLLVENTLDFIANNIDINEE